MGGGTSHNQPSLGSRGVRFPFGKITCYSMKMGLVPLAREGLIPVLKEHVISLRRKMHRNARRLLYCVTQIFFAESLLINSQVPNIPTI